MYGKAQREPARHSVVLDCKLVSLPAVCYITSRGKAGSVFRCEELVEICSVTSEIGR